MEYEKYNHNDNFYHRKERSFFGRKSFIFFSFLFVLGIIFITAFYGGGGITGNVVNSLNQNNSIDLKASLSVPEVKLNGEYKEIILSIKKGSFVNLDNKKISLDEVENKLIIKNFDGNIEINENKIKRLEGKVSEIKINNLPINLQKGGRLKFSISPDANYNSFEINEDVHLKDVSFITSGRIDFVGDSLNLNSEKIRFTNYLGSLKIWNKKLILQGVVEDLKIEGESRKIILSNK